MALFADDDVVVNDDAERFAGGHDRLGHLDIGARRGRITGRVIVYQHNGCRRQIERPFHHLAHLDRCVVHGALLLHLVGYDLVALVEEQDAELLLAFEAH